MVSSVLDNLKLIFSEDYNMSDSDYKKLSDILLQNNLTGNAFDGGLVQIIKLFHKRGISFPVTMNLLQDVWSSEYTKFNFVKMISPLLRDGVIKIKKMSDSALKNNTSILRLPDESPSDINVVIFSSDILKQVIGSFNTILDEVDSRIKSPVTEGVEIVPSKVKGFIDKLNRSLSTLNISVSVESYMKDDSGTEDINMLISGVSNYNVSSSDIQNRFKRTVGRLPFVGSVDAYKESKSELFLGLSLQVQKDYKDLPIRIFNVLNDLEINCVS